MKKMELQTSGHTSSGKKKDLVNSKKSFSLKDKCRLLTIGDYIELVCEDDLSVLVVDGRPSNDALNEAKMEVISEFSELSGDEGSAGLVFSLRKIYKYRAEILGISLALQSLAGSFDESVGLMKEFGVRATVDKNDPESIGKYIRRVQSEIKARNTRMESEIKIYNTLASKSEGKKTTSQDIFEEMSIVSQFTKHEISTSTNLALYAAHRKIIKTI